MEDEIVKLQEIISHQSEDIDRMNSEIYEQQKEIKRLQTQFSALDRKLENMLNMSSDDGGDIRPFDFSDDKPPHY